MSRVVLMLGLVTLSGWSQIRAGAAERPPVTRQEAALLTDVAEVAETNLVAAVERLDEARAPDRASAALDYSAGNLRLALEAYSLAIAAYEAALSKWPAFHEARVGLGRAQALAEQWTEAERTLRAPAMRADATEDLLLLYGYVLLSLNRVISAESIYRRAVLAGGESSDALFGLARCFMEQQRYRECAATMEELVQRVPDEGAYWRLLAEVRLAEAQSDAAIVALEAARRLGAATPEMLLMLADLYVYRDAPAVAVALFDEALQAEPDQPDWWLRAAEGLLQAGHPEKADAWLTQYAAAAEERPARYFRARARWAAMMDLPEEARTAYRSWIEQDPVNVHALLGMGDLLYADGDWTGAEIWYERAQRVDEGSTMAWQRLARVALDRGAYDQAEDYLQRAHVVSGDPAIARTLQQVRRLRGLEP